MATISDYWRRMDRGSRMIAAIIGLNLVMFLLLWLPGRSFTAALFQGVAMPTGWADFIRRPWTMLTFMFAQTNFVSLLFNMLWLWSFYRILEILHHRTHIALLYLLGGISGALLCLLLGSFVHGLQTSRLIGSSASTLAVMGYVGALYPDFKINLLLIGQVKLKWITAICVVLIFLGLGGVNAGGELAHVGGVAFGVLCGWQMRKGRDLFAPLDRWLRTLTAPRPHKPKISERRAARRIEKALSNPRRLDALLDKISTSGFDSLSAQEKRELQILSKRIDKDK